jgi:hypothetical protein
MYTCHDLAARIERLQPQAAPQEVARLCLLLSNNGGEAEWLEDDQRLTEAWHEMGLRLQAAADQHAAMTEELESLSRSNPREFGPDQIWTLVRAIKVQSQILQFYIGESPLDV